MPTVYSHSRLSVFEDCRLRYRLRYVDRVKREREGVEAFLGSRVHETLEALYRDVLMGRTPTADAVVEDFESRWEERWNDAIVASSGRARRNATAAASSCASGSSRLRLAGARSIAACTARITAPRAAISFQRPTSATSTA